MTNASIINDYIAGGIGGCAGMVVGHPLDTIKVQIQTQEYGGKYTGIIDCIKTVNKQNLSKGFFRGLSWPLISYSYLNAVFFGSYGFILQKLDCHEDPDKRPEYLKTGIAAGIGTMAQQLFACPIEVVKITLQSQIPHTHDIPANVQVAKYYKGPLEAVSSIIRKSGMVGMYRGFPTQLVRDIPAGILYMVMYKFIQYESLMKIPAVPSPVVNFIGGGIAGVCSWLIIMPFDVVKSKLQADPQGLMYKGFWDCARRVYAAEGIKAFFLGLVPMSVRAFPVNAVTLMVYTETLIYLKKIEHIED